MHAKIGQTVLPLINVLHVNQQGSWFSCLPDSLSAVTECDLIPPARALTESSFFIHRWTNTHTDKHADSRIPPKTFFLQGGIRNSEEAYVEK